MASENRDTRQHIVYADDDEVCVSTSKMSRLMVESAQRCKLLVMKIPERQFLENYTVRDSGSGRRRISGASLQNKNWPYSYSTLIVVRLTGDVFVRRGSF